MTILLLMTVMMAMMVSKDNHLDYLGEDNVRIHHPSSSSSSSSLLYPD
jgi:hypothetical protein